MAKILVIIRFVLSKLTGPAAKAFINKGLPAFCRAFAAGTGNFDKNNHNNYQKNEDVLDDFQRAAAALSGEN